MERKDCSEKVCPSGEWRARGCMVSATVFEDGKWWCKKHSPSYKQKIADEGRADAERRNAEALQARDRADAILAHLAELGVKATRDYSRLVRRDIGIRMSFADAEALIAMIEGLFDDAGG